MTQDEILEMARQAGAYRRDIGGSIEFLEVFMLERFAKLIAAHTLMNIDPSKFMSYHERNNANTM